MKATRLFKDRYALSETTFVEVVIWELPSPTPPSEHKFKYRLALIVNNECVIRYDNERGKGDHRHYGNQEESYTFTTIDALMADFLADVERLTK